jgi:hypothetical protein
MTTVRDPSTETTPAPDAPKPKKGRGKTTPAVRAGQALAKILAWPAEDRLRLADMIRQGATSAKVREAVKGSRLALKRSVAAQELALAAQEEGARLLDVVESLDPAGRVAILGAIGSVVTPAESAQEDEERA